MSTGEIGAISPEKALFELTILNAEESKLEFDDVFVSGIRHGLPPELLTRLRALWDQARMVGGELIAIGKIIVAKIVEFLKANPKMSAGIAIGAAVGALINGIPFIGTLLTPLAMLLGSLYGAGIGAALQDGIASDSPFTAGIALAGKFLELFISIINAVGQYWEK